MTTINIGIVARVDAGKTSLTERILYETHVNDEIGRIAKGTPQTDSLHLAKSRGITIKASVVSSFVNTLNINLIDTPWTRGLSRGSRTLPQRSCWCYPADLCRRRHSGAGKNGAPGPEKASYSHDHLHQQILLDLLRQAQISQHVCSFSVRLPAVRDETRSFPCTLFRH